MGLCLTLNEETVFLLNRIPSKIGECLMLNRETVIEIHLDNII